MPYDPATRILTASFVRDPEEYADVTLEAGRRMLSEPDDANLGWGRALGVAIAFGVAVGAVMELYRRFVLPLLLAPSDIAPLGTAALEMLPLFLLVAALYLILYARATRRRRRVFLSRLRPGVYVDVDVFANGISQSTDQLTVEVAWSSVRNIFAVRNGMEIEAETTVIFIPERAFESRGAFKQAGRQIREAWHEAQKRDRDSRMVAAGLD